MQVDTDPFGPDSKPMLIAELSANHDRDLNQALALVDIAADAGWHCLKLQTYTAESLTMRSDHPSMKIHPKWGKKTLYELYQSAGMPMEFHEPLFERARERGLTPFTSVYDPCDLDFVEKLNCAYYKIASFELTFDALLAAVANTGKPIILSTGMATMGEVEHALEILEKHSASQITLLHCCTSYPAPLEETNLRAMLSMGQVFNRPVGFSDHTIGSRAALAAAAMGAVAIEKHFTNDMTRDGPDHRFSATPEILREIAVGVEEIHLLRGSAEKKTTAAEEESRQRGRRSAFAQQDLSVGHTLTDQDFRFIRPNAGISANCDESLVGKTLRQDVAAGNPITWAALRAE
jgi:pseudaminic acid synthase